MSHTARSRDEVRSYYRTVGAFLELELAERDDGDYWRSRVAELGRPRVLELGAGTGRITGVLAERARSVVALDLSPEMLQRARRSLGARPGVHFVLADMRELALARSFDLAVAANDPFAHLATDEDRDRALRAIARHLRPGGLFVLDGHWMSQEARRQASGPGGWKHARSLGDPAERLSVIQHWKLDHGLSQGEARYEYHRDGQVVGTASFRPRLWTLEEIRDRLPAAGFRVRRVSGDFREGPWDPVAATHLVVEAVRTTSTQA